MTAEAKSAWSSYWSEGHTESLPKHRAAGLLVGLDSAWRQFFLGFQRGARLLDLATGGGDVIRRALALNRDFEVTGVDLADLSPVKNSFKSPRVRLIGNTELAPLPFPDAVFDGVTSQFGIEYSDAPAACREAIRVLSPEGRGRFVLHHSRSAITRASAESLAAERSAIADGSVFAAGRSAFEHRRSAVSHDGAAGAGEAFRESVRALQSRIGDEPQFDSIRGIAIQLVRLSDQDSISPEDALRNLDSLEQQVLGRALRKQAQIDAAMDLEGVENLARALSAAGASVAPPQELKYPGGHLLGWALAFQK